MGGDEGKIGMGGDEGKIGMGGDEGKRGGRSGECKGENTRNEKGKVRSEESETNEGDDLKDVE